MVSVLFETCSDLSRGGGRLYRRVYLVCGEGALPRDSAPGSVALCREGERVRIRMLFPDGEWGTL